MYINKRSKKLGIDNDEIGLRGIRAKLQEEYKELDNELLNRIDNPNVATLKNVIRETYDVIQMCILILWRCHCISDLHHIPNLVEELNQEHLEKLKDREWEVGPSIEIDIKEVE